MPDKTRVTIETVVKAPVETVWECWNKPEHITKWNTAQDDWHSPRAMVDLREGGTFTARMEAKDGSAGFDFGGTYTKVAPHERIEYVMGDGRAVSVTFAEQGGETRIVETFDAESENSVEMQRGGWQSILDNFKTYAESQA
jgi:uncharacterized protein YndB with AHSA1/START domain